MSYGHGIVQRALLAELRKRQQVTNTGVCLLDLQPRALREKHRRGNSTILSGARSCIEFGQQVKASVAQWQSVQAPLGRPKHSIPSVCSNLALGGPCVALTWNKDECEEFMQHLRAKSQTWTASRTGDAVNCWRSNKN